MDGYNFFMNGWVGNIIVSAIKTQPKKFLLMGSVKHSQQLSASPLKPWVAIKQTGEILCAHCTCMAGIEQTSVDDHIPRKKILTVSKPSSDDIKTFYEELSKSNGKPVILSLVPGHNTSYIPLYEAGTLMRPLTDLHDPKSMALSYPDLLQQCEEIFNSYAFSFTQ